MSCIYIFSAVSESTSKLISLEQVSASSTKRIHYKRFTQGKDLSLASSSDMDSILGRRKVKNVGSDLVILEGYN
jgi:Pin2-interacting protein X1